MSDMVDEILDDVVGNGDTTAVNSDGPTGGGPLTPLDELPDAGDILQELTDAD